MKIEVLMSVMDENPKNILKKSKINTDCIIVNQIDYNKYEELATKDGICRIYSFSEKGVGLSRNTALMRSKADICLMADDDMVYVEGYADIVKSAFIQNPSADMIIFRVDNHKDGKTTTKVKNNRRLHYFNSLKYGTVSFAFRRNSIVKNRIFFSTIFGGGTKFGSGEDSLFLWDCLKSKLKVVTCSEKIADVYTENSTWFKGYNQKYFEDKGSLFYSLSNKFYLFLIVQFLIRHRHTYNREYSFGQVFSFMKTGVTRIKDLK